ncbi:hypothetical protein GCM10011533_08520 [Streptosporangium jomthongense]|nr:hypothetical protein GCM10011533_08520 [Streptosporangium jomthongense]
MSGNLQGLTWLIRLTVNGNEGNVPEPYHTHQAAVVKGPEENRPTYFTLDKTLYIVKPLYKKTGLPKKQDCLSAG